MAEAFASSKGRYGYRRVEAMFRTRVPEKALRRIMAEDGPTAHVPERRGYGSYEGASPGAFRPRMPPPVARMAGAHGPLRPGTVDGRQRPFPGRRRRGGVPRTHEDGVRLSRALGGRTRNGVLVPIDDCIRRHDHGRIKRSLGWMSPVQYRQSQGMDA